MIKIQELKQGDIVRVEEETTEREGTDVDVSREENMVCNNNAIKEFWYTTDQIAANPLTEKELYQIGFEKTDTEEGAKYIKGPFWVIVHDAGNYTIFDIC